MILPSERIALVRARMAEQTREAERLLAGKPAITTAEVLKAATVAITAALPPGAPLPRAIISMQHREDVERLSREGNMTVREIARTVGLSEGHTSFLRGQLGVAHPRRKSR